MGVEVHGTVTEGFEPVREAFGRNFERLGERGAAVTVYRDGRRVVDLWAGTKDVDGGTGTDTDGTGAEPAFAQGMRVDVVQCRAAQPGAGREFCGQRGSGPAADRVRG